MFKEYKAKESFVPNKVSSRFQFTSQDIENTYGIKNIFLTASPNLIIEIEDKYNELRQHIQDYLNQKNRKENWSTNRLIKRKNQEYNPKA
jgi:hypothetical protein